MNCSEATRWLLDDDGVLSLPDEVQSHLRACRRCRRRQRRLQELQHLIKVLPAPANAPAARAEVLQEIRAQAPACKAVRTGVRRRWRVLLVRAAVVLLFISGLGSFLALRTDRDDSPSSASNIDVVPQLVDQHLALAEGQPLEERFRRLAGMAGALRAEAFRAAKDPDAAGLLPTLARLYKSTVSEGLLERAVNLPDAARRELLVPLAAEMRQAEIDLDRAGNQSSGEGAAALRSLAETSRSAQERIRVLLGEKT